MNKELVAKKMGGKCSVCGRSHSKTMHAKQDGKGSLNIVTPKRRLKDNVVMEGRNEQENN